MSRIRTIKPDFWKHERLSELPEATHMLAAALLNYADDEGYFNANPKLIQAECFPLRELSVSIPESIQTLCALGYIRVGSGADGKRYGHVVHFTEHQKISHPSDSKIKKIAIEWEDATTTPGSLPEDSSLKGREWNGEEERGNARGAQKHVVEKAWLAFCVVYPKRKGNDPTQPARDKFERAIRDGADPEAIVRGARGYAEEQSKLGKTGTEFVKQRKAWLNDKGWQDYQPSAPLPAEIATEWVREDDPKWSRAALAWQSSRGKPPPVTDGKNGNFGRGWHFPKTMLEAH